MEDDKSTEAQTRHKANENTETGRQKLNNYGGMFFGGFR